ncbi:terminase [Acinetobacter sp. TGL-Y2]|uniref:terminase large subunit domain-containing protein n=1 Tax=Acinetobacter sp. TGL-Y2 TaxID=1407071 RepID=UPI0007A64577|nr:terminase family protein [Acinetobacter sp. TGL-Y2]AMW79738.1 terminase [Acinetobacter sp. TGL-Y2]
MNTAHPLTFENLNPRQHGRILFAMGMTVSEIAKQIDENRATVESWKQREGWEKSDLFDDVTLGLKVRYLVLTFMENKSNANYKEMDFIGVQFERWAKIERYRQGGTQADLNPKLENRNDKPKKRKLKNQITEEDLVLLEQAFNDFLFLYQQEWMDAISWSRIFILLKSRQIGATYIIALWAFIDLLKTGKNKIFMSASRAQAFQFIEYIKAFCLEVIGVELTGDPIVVNGPNGQASLYYLGTNALTAQGRHGDVIMDEFFWIRSFLKFKKVASAMASQKMYKQIYMSTPSSILHEAYAFWTGTDSKRKLPIEIDVSKVALKLPLKCADRKTRQIVTLDDAEAKGCDLFDRDDLFAEYGDEEFANLFDCDFIDDSGSYFPLKDIIPNMVDSWEIWNDFNPNETPHYQGEVWIGYDPSFTGDNAALAVIAPPPTSLSPYRVLEVKQFKGQTAQEQSLYIKKVFGRYNVTFIGIDNTGNGLAVSEYVSKFFPALTRLNYNPELKIRMGLRAKELFQKRRLNFDAGLTIVAKAFLSIKKAMTSGGGNKTLVTSRSAENGHGDIAWAIMNGLEKAPIIDITDPSQQGAARSRIRVFKS